MFCCRCGKRLDDDMQYCPFCGGKVIIPNQEEASDVDFKDDKPQTTEPSKLEKTIVPIRRRNSAGTNNRVVPIKKPAPSDIIVGETRAPSKSTDKPRTIVPLYDKFEEEDKPVLADSDVKYDTPVFKKPELHPDKPKTVEEKTPSVYDVEEEVSEGSTIVADSYDDDDFTSNRFPLGNFKSRLFSGKHKSPSIEDLDDDVDQEDSEIKPDPYDLEDDSTDEYDFEEGDDSEDEFDDEYSSDRSKTAKHKLWNSETVQGSSDAYDDREIESSFIFRHLRSIIGAFLFLLLLLVNALYFCSDSGQNTLAHIGLAWNAKAYSRLGLEAYNNEDYEGAGAYYKKALSHDPDNFQYATSVAMAYISANNRDASVEALTEAIRINPYALEPYLYLMNFYPDAETRPDSIQLLIEQGYSYTLDERLAQ